MQQKDLIRGKEILKNIIHYFLRDCAGVGLKKQIIDNPDMGEYDLNCLLLIYGYTL